MNIAGIAEFILGNSTFHENPNANNDIPPLQGDQAQPLTRMVCSL